MGDVKTASCLTDFRLDKLMAGELDAGAAASARQHLDGCAACASRMAELTADRDHYRGDLPPMAARAAAEARVQEAARAIADDRTDGGSAPASPSAARRARPQRRLHRWVPAVGLAAAAACILVFWPRATVDDGTDRPSMDGTTRRKGGPSLGFYRNRDGRVTAGASGDVLRAGDEVRFAVTSDGPSYLVIGAVDGRGNVAIYFPPEGTSRAQAIEAGSDRLLPDAFALDDTVGPERVFGLFCAEPIPVADARAALAAPAPALPGCLVDRIDWVKRAR